MTTRPQQGPEEAHVGSLDAGHLTTLVALAAAFASAATFGLSTSLQHRVAGGTDAAAHSGGTLLVQLLRRPSWVVGLGLSVVAFALHAAAIDVGSLALVQPVIVTGVVFAVLIRAALDRRLPSAREVAWTSVTWSGLTLFLATVRPGGPHVVPGDVVTMGFSAVALGTAAVAVRLADAARTPERRGLWFGIGAGVLFGLVAGLLKIVVSAFALDPMQGLVSWQVWVMVASGIWAMTMNQRAYQVTRLSVSMPVLNVVDVLVALAFASVVFGEDLVGSPAALVAEVLGLALMAVGVWRLTQTQELDGLGRPGTAGSGPGGESAPDEVRREVGDPAPGGSRRPTLRV